MLVFLDESGDPGLKVGKGSTLHLVVSLVVFEDGKVAQAVNDRITSLRPELRLPLLHEFSFYGSSERVRKAFLRAVAPYEFFYCSTVIDKGDPEKLWQLGFGVKKRFYANAAELVFADWRAFLNEAIVTIDGKGQRHFVRRLQGYLKRCINDPGQRCVRKVRLQPSSGNNLLQLADMVSGSIRRSFGKTDDAKVYRQIIRHREKGVKVWPK